MHRWHRVGFVRLSVVVLALVGSVWAGERELSVDDSQLNIVFILCDDHRYDCLGILGHPFLETPNLDRLARGGAVMQRAYVTTSLCSPSRASILTGLYAHNHGVVDNYHSVDRTLVFFPQHLQQAGYETAFIGKWHMGGDVDDPQRGFDHWVAFKGQGTYWPDGRGTTRVVPQTSYSGLNVNGRRVPQQGYITDELTEYALKWLRQREGNKPFFLYLSHKAVHSDFVPADRHRDRYQDQALPIDVPSDEQMSLGRKPMWVRNQRNSRHGVEFGYNLPHFDVSRYYQRYCESLLAVDDSVGRIVQHLTDSDLLNRTLIVYMGDNGFQFGDHGLIDKRTAYESSARVPLILSAEGHIPPRTRSDRLVANIDIAPTLLQAAGAEPLTQADGISFWNGLSEGQPETQSREYLLYEYYWERNYPQTPTLHALIGGRWKYIRAHGIWDRDELYDLTVDPNEMHNLINRPEHEARVEQLNHRLWELLSSSGGMNMPLLEDRGQRFPLRDSSKSSPAPFPQEYLRP